ncbi:MAG: type II 3-dehydroquinate dehydratase [Cocleimonas sp.]|nr:type II 3-dehydroquinate dehydratase [Cocleimonas sp.]
MAKILLLNGPNLNLLGQREPGHYGTLSLANIEKKLQQIAIQNNHQLDCFQSNAEHKLVDRIHAAHIEDINFILFNPAAFTHTSIALRDALLATKLPFIEVHLSNVYKRETFRHHSYFSDIAEGCIIGLGPKGYELALDAAINKLDA